MVKKGSSKSASSSRSSRTSNTVKNVKIPTITFTLFVICMVLTINYFNPTFFVILAKNNNLAFISIATVTLFTYFRINQMLAMVLLAVSLLYVYMVRNRVEVEKFLNDYSNYEMLQGMTENSTVCTDNSCGDYHMVNKGQLSNSVEHLWYHPATNTLTENIEGFTCSSHVDCACEMCNCDNGCNGSCAGKNCGCNNKLKQSLSGLPNALHAQGNYADLPGLNPAPVSKLQNF